MTLLTPKYLDNLRTVPIDALSWQGDAIKIAMIDEIERLRTENANLNKELTSMALNYIEAKYPHINLDAVRRYVEEQA